MLTLYSTHACFILLKNKSGEDEFCVIFKHALETTGSRLHVLFVYESACYVLIKDK